MDFHRFAWIFKISMVFHRFEREFAGLMHPNASAVGTLKRRYDAILRGELGDLSSEGRRLGD